MWKHWASGLLILTVVWSAAAVFSFNLCDLIFDCGCESMWAGGADHCNIHTPGVKHCPWCVATGGLKAFIGIGLFVPPALLSFLPWGWTWRRRLPVALVSVVVSAFVTGWISGWVTGYWA